MTEDEEPAWKRLGSQIPSAEPSQSSSALTRSRLPSDSETTGSGVPARRASRRTGPPRGETGVVGRPSGEAATEYSIRETDRALVALLRQCASSSLTWTPTDIEGDDGQYETTIWHPQNAKEVEHEAIDAIRHACMPLPAAETAKLLGRLRVMTVPREQSSDDMRFLIGVYEDACEEYPADVVRYVLASQPKMSKWFPAWAELQVRLDRYARQRFVLRDALAKREARAA